MPIGPAALGHDPVVLEEQREQVLEMVEETGVVSFREDPLLPFMPDKD